ncbi:MutS-related protein [Candidatus Epulonipiscium viviparus]|uniref:MutS-related protein n=1 Tax=Candidatus Epulonipiscium viviparus TaxID=420336 RepID=UPI000498569B|nr:hypothetical protein [Candidatus Epulopiscium viviparus]
MSIDDFNVRIYKARQEEIFLTNRSNQFVTLRLFTVIGFLLCLYFYIKSAAFTSAVLATALSFTFAIEVVLHVYTKKKLRVAQITQAINQDYIRRIGDEWKNFIDTGVDLADANHPYAFDLDIVGPASLFQKISICKSFMGRIKLADFLLHQSDIKVSESRQKAVNELTYDIDFLIDLQVALGEKSEIRKNPEFWLNIENIKIFESNLVNLLMKTTPYAIIIMLFLGNFFTIAAVILVIINIGLYLLDKNKANVALIQSASYQIEPYLNALSVAASKSFTSSYLSYKSSDIFNAIDSLKQLEKISSLASVTRQPLLALPLNGIFMWDFWITHLCLQWQQQYSGNLRQAISFLAEVEALASLTTLNLTDQTIFPQVTATKIIRAEALGHPLISAQTRVANTFKMNDEVLIITGSNMSGKTTFLRTIGINLVLAYAGAGVTAKNFHCGEFNIHTSMRINDNLGEHTSSFHAEIKRIKLILNALQSTKPLFFLIDEIFRGTNSKDRINGAKGVIRSLKNNGAIGLITTHDLEMCTLDQLDGIKNYHFEDFFDNQQMFFDYKLKHGVSTKTNARYLLEMIGIVMYE